MSLRSRRLQGAEPEPEPESAGIEVRWKVKASSGDHASSVADSFLRCGGPGSDLNDGSVDYGRCADDPTFRQCHSEACMGADWGQAHAEGKGRRLEQADEENEELRAKLAAAESFSAFIAALALPSTLLLLRITAAFLSTSARASASQILE